MAEDLVITFRRPGNGPDFLGAGWSTHEPDGMWMLDDESTLLVPRPEQAGDYLLELELGSLLVPQRPFQRLSVQVNGAVVGSQVLRGDTVVQCWVPWPLLAGPPLSVVTLAHPDGWSPSESWGDDRRVLSLHARVARLSLLTDRPSAAAPAEVEAPAPAGPPPVAQAEPEMHALLLDFESLGTGRALGLVQRHHGAEPLGLFRLGHTPLDGLLAALDGALDADGFGGRASLVLDPEARAYVLVDRAHGFEWYTGLHEGQADPAALERQARARLPWLARRFAEVLTSGEKLLVLCDEGAPVDPAKVALLLAALRRRGGATLLWVGAAGGGHAAGDVERAGEGLLRGWVDGSMASWETVCRQAHRLW
ncbi:MAG: hypothetical protein ACRYG6_02410 [Janthinobacterium lividum]